MMTAWGAAFTLAYRTGNRSVDPADGRLLALELVVITVVIALAARARLPSIDLHLGSGRGAATAGVSCIVLLVVLASATGHLATAGSVVGGSVGERAPTGEGRIASVSLDTRPALWRVGEDVFVRHPITGAGIGSFQQEWDLHRTIPNDFRWAHSLYIETAAELGVVGLAFLGSALVLPLFAARRRGSDWSGIALGAYVAFLIHAGVDWDWQVPGVTVLALVFATILVLGEQPRCKAEPIRASRFVLGTVLLGLLVASGLTFMATHTLARARADLDAGHWVAAESAASTAHTWQPWSYEPWDVSFAAAGARGQRDLAVRAARMAIKASPRRWISWLELSEASSGAERRNALSRARHLNPAGARLLYSARRWEHSLPPTAALDSALRKHPGSRRLWQMQPVRLAWNGRLRAPRSTNKTAARSPNLSGGHPALQIPDAPGRIVST